MDMLNFVFNSLQLSILPRSHRCVCGGRWQFQRIEHTADSCGRGYL